LTESFITDTSTPELIAKLRQRAGKPDSFTDGEVKRPFPDEPPASFLMAATPRFCTTRTTA
jgi:hypothetical protein